MYSSDAYGLGHYRRLLKLAACVHQALPEASILLVTGSSMAHAFRLPPGVDYVKLPSLTMEDYTTYSSKYLSLPIADILALRQRLLLETARAYRPHFLLVDKHPVGLQGELLPTLEALQEFPWQPRVVLGLRDILDDPRVIVPYFHSPAAAQVLAERYDEIWVYGCQALFDPLTAYGFPQAVARKVRFCGYLRGETAAASSPVVRRELGMGDGKFVLVTVGAGGDGFALLDLYLQALALFPRETEVFSLLISGPDMPALEQERLRLHCHHSTVPAVRHARVLEFSPHFIDYLAAADSVVCMGGYNTLSEVLSLGKQAVVLPRFSPLREQWLRATAFAQQGLIRLVPPSHASPQALADAVQETWHPSTLPFAQRLAAAGIDLNGREAVTRHVLRLLAPHSGKTGSSTYNQITLTHGT
jgi:predicted glycosyltransferase